MAKGKNTKSMRTLTIIDVENYTPEDLDFMKGTTRGMSGENLLVPMADFLQLLQSTLKSKKTEQFIQELKKMNITFQSNTDGSLYRKIMSNEK